MRRFSVVLWALCTGFGLYVLLGLTGLGLACAFVTSALRTSRAHSTVTVALPEPLGKTYERLDSRPADGHFSASLVGAPRLGEPLVGKPLVGEPLRCWVCPWCVGYAAQDGGWYWVFRDEVSASVYADIRRRLLSGGEA